MYRIIIVDDEVNAIEGLKLLIDTKRNNISEILSSTNAIEALEVIKREHPDIIISDISMPQMTGLEMIAEIKKMDNYNPMMIILSGYSTFSYAQTAIASGVKAYLLKPVDEDELNDKIDELIGEIEANSQQAFEKNIVLEGALIKILNGDNSKKTVSSFLSLLNYNKGDDIVIAHSDIIYRENKDVELSDEDLDRDFDKIQNIFTSSFGNCVQANAFKISGDGMLCIISAKNLTDNLINNSINAFKTNTANALLVDLPITISEKITSDKFVDTLKEMLSSNTSPSIFDNILVDGTSGRDFKEINDIFLSLSNNFDVLYRDEIKAKLEEGIDLAVAKNMKIQGFNPLFTAFLMNISKYVLVDNMSMDELLKRAKDIFVNVKKLKEDKAIIVNFILSLYDDMSDYNKKMQNETLHNIIAYVNNNYTENLTLKSLASKFYANPIYLGRIFKKETGTLFNEYLTNLRIEKSKVLLKKTNKKVYEIAEEIGFNDPNYFIAKFLKREGITPSQFRKKID
ncbi:MAG: response regulator [Clostridia bacterium]|nr:response regulator [Clostridia bacterium]